MRHLKVNHGGFARIVGASPSFFFFFLSKLVSLLDLREWPLGITRTLLQGAITGARDLLNPRFDGFRIQQEDLKRDDEQKIAHPKENKAHFLPRVKMKNE